PNSAEHSSPHSSASSEPTSYSALSPTPRPIATTSSLSSLEEPSGPRSPPALSTSPTPGSSDSCALASAKLSPTHTDKRIASQILIAPQQQTNSPLVRSHYICTHIYHGNHGGHLLPVHGCEHLSQPQVPLPLRLAFFEAPPCRLHRPRRWLRQRNLP